MSRFTHDIEFYPALNKFGFKVYEIFGTERVLRVVSAALWHEPIVATLHGIKQCSRLSRAARKASKQWVAA